MVEFKFIEYGTDFGTRDMGQKLRQKILPLINSGEKVVLDLAERSVLVALQRRYKVIKDSSPTIEP